MYGKLDYSYGVAPSSEVFSPISLSPVGWWDPSIGSSVTTGPFQMNDLSGNDHHLKEPTWFYEPDSGTRTLNGLNALDFNSNGEKLRTDSVINISGELDFWVVYSADTAENDHFIYLDSGGDRLGWLGSGESRYRLHFDTVENLDFIISHVIETTYIVRLYRDSGDDFYLEQDGIDSGETGNDDSVFPYRGINRGTTTEFDGLLGEQILFDRNLTSAEAADVLAYLRRWQA